MARFARCTVAGTLMVICLAGCETAQRAPRGYVRAFYPHATQETVTQTSSEHYQTVKTIAQQDARALVYDLDLFFQTERPTRLTRWHAP